VKASCAKLSPLFKYNPHGNDSMNYLKQHYDLIPFLIPSLIITTTTTTTTAAMMMMHASRNNEILWTISKQAEEMQTRKNYLNKVFSLTSSSLSLIMQVVVACWPYPI